MTVGVVELLAALGEDCMDETTIQATIAEAKNQALVGTVHTVLVDGPSAEQPGVWCARTAGHAPDVDGTVFLRGFDGPAGVFARVQIEEAFEHDLTGRVLELLP